MQILGGFLAFYPPLFPLNSTVFSVACMKRISPKILFLYGFRLIFYYPIRFVFKFYAMNSLGLGANSPTGVMNPP